MTKLNEYSYAGEVLKCLKCGNVVIVCHGQDWDILECKQQTHSIQHKFGTDQTKYEVKNYD